MDGLRSPDLREALTALRDLLAQRIADADPNSTAPLARQLADVLLKLDGLPGEEQSDLDDLTRRREARRAQVSDDSGSKVVGG